MDFSYKWWWKPCIKTNKNFVLTFLEDSERWISQIYLNLSSLFYWFFSNTFQQQFTALLTTPFSVEWHFTTNVRHSFLEMHYICGEFIKNISTRAVNNSRFHWKWRYYYIISSPWWQSSCCAAARAHPSRPSAKTEQKCPLPSCKALRYRLTIPP